MTAAKHDYKRKFINLQLSSRAAHAITTRNKPQTFTTFVHIWTQIRPIVALQHASIDSVQTKLHSNVTEMSDSDEPDLSSSSRHSWLYSFEL